MRKFISLFFLLFITSSSSAAVVIQDKINELHLTMKPLDSQVIFRKEYNDESSFPVSVVTKEGKNLEGRVKVSGSFSRRFSKKNIIIKLTGDQRWNGQKRISLDAMATDGSMMREWLTWQLIKDLGMAGPKVEYLRLYINNEYRGLFLQTEWVDAKMFDRFGLGKDGQFFHPIDEKYCGDFRFYENNTVEQCWFNFSPNNKDYSSLKEAYKKIKETPINEFDQYIANNFDEGSLLNWIAINVLTSNGDTYNKNYFLYQPTATKKWIVIPWDYDLSYGRNWDPHYLFPKNILNDNFQYYYPPQLGATNPLKEKVLRNPALNKKFIARVFHLLGIKKEGEHKGFGWFSPAQMKARTELMAAKLQPYRAQDPFLQILPIKFDKETQSLWHYTQRRHAYLKEILAGEFPWDPEIAIWEFNADKPVERIPFPKALRIRQTIPQSQQFHMVSAQAFGYSLMGIRLNDNLGPADFSTESEIQLDLPILPAGVTKESCIQRNWYLSLLTPFQSRTIDLQLEYLQENSQRHEIGKNVDEAKLKLWALDGREWKQVNSEINTLSNVFTVKGLVVEPGSVLRFVGCSAE